jgi:hypothetical protein
MGLTTALFPATRVRAVYVAVADCPFPALKALLTTTRMT